MLNIRQNSNRNFRGKAGMSCTMPTYADVVLDVIRREYGPLKNAAKLLARDARTTPRTAENWIAGTNSPNGEKFINLMANCEVLADEIYRLIAERRAERGE